MNKPIDISLDLCDQLLDEKLSPSGRNLLRHLLKELGSLKIRISELEYDLERANAANSH